MKVDKEERKRMKPKLQPVDETVNAMDSGPFVESAPEWILPEQDEPLHTQQRSGDLFAENEFDYLPEVDHVKQNDDAIHKNDIKNDNEPMESESKIKELEKEKEDLQQRLYDAKDALNEYSAKLDRQVMFKAKLRNTYQYSIAKYNIALQNTILHCESN